MIVAGATLGNFSPDPRKWFLLNAIGNASYALYLFHPLPIRGFVMLLPTIGIDVAKAPWLFMVIAVAVAVLLASAIHEFFERPVGTALRNFFRSDRPGSDNVQPGPETVLRGTEDSVKSRP